MANLSKITKITPPKPYVEWLEKFRRDGLDQVRVRRTPVKVAIKRAYEVNKPPPIQGTVKGFFTGAARKNLLISIKTDQDALEWFILWKNGELIK